LPLAPNRRQPDQPPDREIDRQREQGPSWAGSIGDRLYPKMKNSVPRCWRDGSHTAASRLHDVSCVFAGFRALIAAIARRRMREQTCVDPQAMRDHIARTRSGRIDRFATTADTDEDGYLFRRERVPLNSRCGARGAIVRFSQAIALLAHGRHRTRYARHRFGAPPMTPALAAICEPLGAAIVSPNA